MRNFRLLRVSPDGFHGFAALLRGEARVVSGLPADASCVRAGYDPLTDDAVFVFTSAEFGPVRVPHRARDDKFLVNAVGDPQQF